MHISPPSWTSLPSLSPPHPSRLIQSPFEFLEPYSKFPLAIYFTYHNVSFHVTLSMSISLFSMFVNKFFNTIFLDSIYMRSVQLLSRVWLFVTPWTAARQASLSITNSQSPPKPMSIESVMPSNHLILCHPLLLLHSIFPSIRVFSNESALCIRWPKYWSFSFNISPSNEHPDLP